MRIPIPAIQRQAAPNPANAGPMASGVPVNGVENLGAALFNVGANMQQAANVEADRAAREAAANLARVEHEQRKNRVMERSRDDRLKWQETMIQRQTEAPEGAEGFTPAMLKDFDTYRQEATKAITDPEERAMYDGMLGSLREHVGVQSLVFQSGARASYRAKSLTEGVEKSARLVTVDPSQMPDVLAQELALIRSSSDLTAEQRSVLAERAKDTLSWAAAQTLVKKAPDAFLARIGMTGGKTDIEKASRAVQNDAVLSQLPPARLQQAIDMAMVEVQRKVTEGRYEIGQRTRDVQAMVLTGETPPKGVAPTVAEYTAIHGASGAAIWQHEVGNYLEVGAAIQQMKTATAEEREALARDTAPTVGPGYEGKLQTHKAVLQARSMVEDQIIADPAAYALKNSSRVQQAANVMQRVLNDPKTSAGDHTAVIDFYARTSIAEQQRLGIDTIRDAKTGNKNRQPQLLTNEQANAISDSFHSQASGGEKAAQLVTSLEAQWGQYWPQVYGQLANANKLPPAALVIPNMQNDGSRARLATASAMKSSELKDLLEPTVVKDIRDGILSQFERSQRTFTAQGADGNRTLSIVMGEAEKLAMLYRANGRSTKDAVTQAYTETMGWKYEFADTYRIPLKEKPNDVRAGATYALRGIKPADVTLFVDGAHTVVAEDALRNRAMWITAGDESGLQLMMSGQDGGVYAVRDKEEKPVIFSWSKLRSMSATAELPAVQRAVDIEEMQRRQRELNPRR